MNRLVSGVDLIEIGRLEQYRAEKPALWARFLKRVYTSIELQQAGESLQSLAGIFAAKEAAAKALGCGIGPISWQELEIQKADSGAPTLIFYGKALALSKLQGFNTWSVSITHTRSHALAFVVAMLQTEGPGGEA